uniref:Uncharacterized protein n=1 Tax=Cannabis sativa TaxID=3483 RepID=A0A803QLI8_CANSA
MEVGASARLLSTVMRASPCAFAVYLLELDRQENRSEEIALAPKWWIPFKYKLVQTLVDERDGSIFGAILEWDRSAALSELILIRPSGAPRAVLALRGTLLKSLTFRRDIEDDLRFLAWESLKGSIRFKVALEALKSVAEKYGSSNVCIAGHSLGAGFALQVGKTLAKEGIYVDTHLFNPPSVSLAMSLRNIGEKAENLRPRAGQMAAKLFVMSKGNQKFLEAHGLEQWWSDDLELNLALHNSKLISRQLKSLYSLPNPKTQGKESLA